MKDDPMQVSTCAEVDTKPAATKRRCWSMAFKRELVATTFEPGVSVSAVARQHDLNTNLLFKWRRKLGGAVPVPQAALHPVRIVPEEERGLAPAMRPEPASSTVAGAVAAPAGRTAGSLEIALPGGVRMTVQGSADPALVAAALAAVLQGARRR
jgi:transposase